jgi:hypothetical protein
MYVGEPHAQSIRFRTLLVGRASASVAGMQTWVPASAHRCCIPTAGGFACCGYSGSDYPRRGCQASLKALESLTANADVIDDGGKPRLTDPMFEYWLQTRGLTPAGGEDA